MMIREGYFIHNCPDYPVTEADAINLLQFLSDDIQSASPQIQWGFHPTRSNLSVFVGDGLNGGKNRVVFEKGPIKGGYQVIFTFYDGAESKYTMVDLCLGPLSELHELYTKVSRAVHTATWKRRVHTTQPTLIIE
ncbi:MAG: hypothetical protein IIV41_05705 [Akkermansia sp.]|jgi:hypothetical protein|nr:hypothetical protein [Akkermansia sp.]